MRISDWSSDVCSSDLQDLVRMSVDLVMQPAVPFGRNTARIIGALIDDPALVALLGAEVDVAERVRYDARAVPPGEPRGGDGRAVPPGEDLGPETHGGAPSDDGRCCANHYRAGRSAEHTTELQSLMRT